MDLASTDKGSRGLRIVVFGAVVTGILVIAALGFASVQYCDWVGHKDLEVRFLVLDFDMRAPIPNARVNIRSDSSFHGEGPKPPATLECDRSGIAKCLYKGCMCTGLVGGWGPWAKDSFHIMVPDVMVDVEAPGYVPTDDFNLLGARNQRHDRGQEYAIMDIVIKLRRE
jgi:hypothetical protein